MISQQRLDVREVGDVTVVRFHDQRIGEHNGVDQLGRELFDVVEGRNRKRVVLNFSSVDFMSSSALGKLIMADKKARARGGLLKISNVGPELQEGFAFNRLDRLFDIRRDEADALAAFG